LYYKGFSTFENVSYVTFPPLFPPTDSFMKLYEVLYVDFTGLWEVVNG